MISLIEIVHSLFDFAVRTILLPFNSLSPLFGLIALSVIAGIVLIKLYGLVSNQGRIRNIKRKIYGALLEALLFNHDMRVSLRAQGRMLRSSIVYFLLAIPPLLVLAVPCILLMAQMNNRYGYRPVKAGESVLLQVQVKDPALLDSIRVEGAPEIQTGLPFRSWNDLEAWWNITPSVAIGHNKRLDLNIIADQGKTAATLMASLVVGAKAPEIESRRSVIWWENLLFPASRYFSKLPPGIEAVRFSYPEQSYKVLGIDSHWVIIFLIVSLISGLIGSKFLKVEI